MFYESHRAEIILFEATERRMNEILNGRTQIPLKSWQAERMKLTAERSKLNSQYQTLKDEIREMETIRRSADSVQMEITPTRTAVRHKEMEI